MAVTPFLVRLGDRSSGECPARGRTGGGIETELTRHVIVAGFGRVGRAIAVMLEETAIPFVVLEHDLRRVPPGPREQRKVFYGDGSDPRILRSIAADRAAALVITLDRPAAAERLVAAARPLYPDLATSCAATTPRSARGCGNWAPPSWCRRHSSSA